jgi:ParB family transcriptional regulator, chromosome partitioning protein
MSSFEDREIPLVSITRLSPLNPRLDMESDVSSLAATIRARGLLQPIVVREIARAGFEDQTAEYEVLDGGRRWRALRSLYLVNTDGGSYGRVSVRVFDGSDSEAREAAIAVSVTQKPLHPVDEYEAFAALEAGGFSIADIARDFAQSETQIKQRLALGRLSPRVLALWREGTIDREQAIAFTCGPIAAQEAVLDRLGVHNCWAMAIRRELRSNALEAHRPEAKFLRANESRLALYLQREGRIEENLFEEGAIFLDGALARKVADELLLVEAQCVAEAEGWGGACLSNDASDPDPVGQVDLTEAEDARLKEIEKERHAAAKETLAALDQEADAIAAKAILRGVPKFKRAELAVRVGLDSEGQPYFERAIPMRGAAKEEDDDAGEQDEAPAPKGKKARPPEPPPPPEPGANMAEQARRILDAAQLTALREATRENVNLALTIAVAALGSCRSGEAITGRAVGTSLKATIGWPFPSRSGLLCAIGESRFDKALVACLKAEYPALLEALAELIAGSIDIDKCDWKDVLPLLSAASRRADMPAALRAAFDYREYFLSAGKEAAVEAIRAIDGDAAANAASKLKKAALADRAAVLAKDKNWLPVELLAAIGAKAEAPKKKDKRTTAEAMVEAIDKDETNKETVASFLDEETVEGEGVKASDLYQTFVGWAEALNISPMTVATFAKALEANGIAKKRIKTGIHYLGLRLREEPVAEAAQ